MLGVRAKEMCKEAANRHDPLSAHAAMHADAFSQCATVAFACQFGIGFGMREDDDVAEQVIVNKAK